ncbi:glycosyltransferase family 2 protein [Rufibacter hautae]|uniref:Glycosyltransferase n=1 Tax=Rufibacter hautae TaxID=2595005 RepID=A0A5B6TSW7_9BACT|nr:glycosyltransferase [Rufibacter hautae]KAA3439588.1 glycosyltransferase [Rufibacter hautae]
MSRIPSFPPQVPPVPPGEHRPLWSVMIPAYNCAGFLAEALGGVLAQDPGPALMQIEVVDDASTDADLEPLVRELGRGRVGYHRQPRNVGSLRNFETCLNRARGRLVHLLHGDDRVRPGFYARMGSLFQRFPQAGAAFCRNSFINKDGVWSHDTPLEANKDLVLDNWLLRIAERQRIQYVSIVVQREVYERLGGFFGMPYGEDWEMWVRIARFYPVAYTPEILAECRMHASSISSRMGTSGQSFPYLIKCHALIQEHIKKADLPESLKAKAIAKGKLHCALYSLSLAKGIYKRTQNSKLAMGYIKSALQLSKHPLVYVRVLKLCVKLALLRHQLHFL